MLAIILLCVNSAFVEPILFINIKLTNLFKRNFISNYFVLNSTYRIITITIFVYTLKEGAIDTECCSAIDMDTLLQLFITKFIAFQ